MSSADKIRVVELFAGVGGFHIGLTKASNRYGIVWSNQWEPATKEQHASNIYVSRFPHTKHSNQDISIVPVKEIPDHDLLVGGFPCQDYSVARTLNQAQGLVGKKGVLWWQIHRILKEKKEKSPDLLMLENVDRLIKSPAKQRGRDFAIMLASLSDLGYIVEWRVINAADYGMPQRRRRVFIMGYKKKTVLNDAIRALEHPLNWILEAGTIVKAFPINEGPENKPIHDSYLSLKGDLKKISDAFKGDANMTPFENTGIMIDRKVFTLKTTPEYHGKRTLIKDILQDEKTVPDEYFIDNADLKKWKYLKGPKKEKRVSNTGFEYDYSEGGMSFPDPVDKPSRTIITGEGGKTPSRFKHVIHTRSGRLRRLTPVELERLNMFPDNHTKGVSDVKRAFFMGNALVVGIIENLGRQLSKTIDEYAKKHR